jgi:hypothetical protein
MITADAISSIVQCGVSARAPICHIHGRTGCGQWEREPGIDDDDWNPMPPAVVAAPAPAAPPLPGDRRRRPLG